MSSRTSTPPETGAALRRVIEQPVFVPVRGGDVTAEGGGPAGTGHRDGPSAPRRPAAAGGAARARSRHLARLAVRHDPAKRGAAALAARRITDTQLDHLRAPAREMDETGTFREWSEQDTLLHLVVADVRPDGNSL